MNDNQEQPLERGRVISYFGNSVAVETANGQIFPCHLKRNQTLPVVGDEVLWQRDKEEAGMIVEVLTRQSILARGDKYGNLKPIAANIDFIIVVMAPAPIFAEYLIDRYFVAAEILKIQPMLVLNKIDLLSTKDKKAAQARLKAYQALSYPVIATSITTKTGLKKLAASLRGKSSVLVGPSGVGKSSIIAALTKNDDIRIGEVSNKGGGKHTTTATRYYHLPGGGSIIDSPGVREFALWTVSKKEVLQGFPEFVEYYDQCKFRDCQHLVEPGCAIQAAVKANKISEQRYQSYQTLLKLVRT